jgi:hypothetical protein
MVQLLQTELSVARGEAAQSNTKFEMLKADYEALNRNKIACAEVLEREVSELQAKLADSLAEKAATQIRLHELEHDKCQLCVQVCTWSSCMLVEFSPAKPFFSEAMLRTMLDMPRARHNPTCCAGGYHEAGFANKCQHATGTGRKGGKHNV